MQQLFITDPTRSFGTGDKFLAVLVTVAIFAFMASVTHGTKKKLLVYIIVSFVWFLGGYIAPYIGIVDAIEAKMSFGGYYGGRVWLTETISVSPSDQPFYYALLKLAELQIVLFTVIVSVWGVMKLIRFRSFHVMVGLVIVFVFSVSDYFLITNFLSGKVVLATITEKILYGMLVLLFAGGIFVGIMAISKSKKTSGGT